MNNKTNPIKRILFAILLVLVGATLTFYITGEQKNVAFDNSLVQFEHGKRDSREDCDSLEVPHGIWLDEAINYLVEFSKNKTCTDFGDSFGFGGYIPIEVANNPASIVPAYAGIILFPTIKDRLIRRDQLQFAERQVTICPGYMDPNVLITPGDRFAISRNTISFPNTPPTTPEAMKDFLESIVIDDIENTTHDSSSAKNILLGNYDYKYEYKNASNYANYGFGFIRKEFMDTLKTQPFIISTPEERIPAGYCIFLGFSEGNDDEKVRMVLFPVNRFGKIYTTEGTYCLEKSWPPINPNKK